MSWSSLSSAIVSVHSTQLNETTAQLTLNTRCEVPHHREVPPQRDLRLTDPSGNLQVAQGIAPQDRRTTRALALLGWLSRPTKGSSLHRRSRAAGSRRRRQRRGDSSKSSFCGSGLRGGLRMKRRMRPRGLQRPIHRVPCWRRKISTIQHKRLAWALVPRWRGRLELDGRKQRDVLRAAHDA